MSTACIRCRTEKPDLKHRSFKWREITAWSMLDFSNSIVLMVLLGSYTGAISNYIYPEEDKSKAGANLMYANIAVAILTFIISPPIGTLVDDYYIRLPIVLISVVGYSAMSMALYGVKRGDEVRPIVLYAFGSFFFRFNEMVTGSFLPGLCNERDMNFVSSYGYFIGFLSGIIVLLLVLLFTTAPSDYDLNAQRDFTIDGYSTAMLVCGIVELLSAIPPLLLLDNGIPEGEKRPKFTRHTIPTSFKKTGMAIKRGFTVNKVLTAIMVAYILISIPIQAIASFGTTFILTYIGPRTAHKRSISDVTAAGIYYNAGVAVFSVVWALLSWVMSAYWIVIILLLFMIVGQFTGIWYRWMPIDGAVRPSQVYIWFMYVMFSVSVGPVQALMRGTIGLLAPEERKGEVFGCLESMILVGVIIGSTIPQLLVFLNDWAFTVFGMVFIVIALIVWIFIPVRREEKKAWARIKAAGETSATGEMAASAGIGVELGGSGSDDSSSSEGSTSTSTSSSGSSGSATSSSSSSSSSSGSSSNSNEEEEENNDAGDDREDDE